MATFESYCSQIDEILYQMRQLPDHRDARFATELRSAMVTAKSKRAGTIQRALKNKGPQHDKAAAELEEEMAYAGISPLYRIDNANNGLIDYGIRFTIIGVIEERLRVPLEHLQPERLQQSMWEAYDLVCLGICDVAFQRNALGNKPISAEQIPRSTQEWQAFADLSENMIDKLCRGLAPEAGLIEKAQAPVTRSSCFSDNKRARRGCATVSIRGEAALRYFVSQVS